MIASALHSQDPAVRRKAVETLGKLGPEDLDSLVSLAHAVGDDDTSVREAAIESLEERYLDPGPG